MAVYGVSNTAGTPVVFAAKNLQNLQQPAAAGIAETNSTQETQKKSFAAKTVLTLAALGAITFGLIRYRNAQALKPIIQNFEKATNDGGKLTTRLVKTKVKNPDGTTTTQLVKSVKTHFDKDGKKHAQTIHDFQNHERYTVFYDKDGNVYTRNGNSVTTATSCVDYSGKTPVQKYSFSKTEELSVPNT